MYFIILSYSFSLNKRIKINIFGYILFYIFYIIHDFGNKHIENLIAFMYLCSVCLEYLKKYNFYLKINKCLQMKSKFLLLH